MDKDSGFEIFYRQSVIVGLDRHVGSVDLKGVE